MKKILLLVALMTTLLFNAQVNKMEGSWVSETSSYVMTIITDNSIPVKVFNTSFSKNDFIEEYIVSSDGETLITKLHNPDNGYYVDIKYILKDSNTMICEYTGDLNKTVTVKKLSHFYIDLTVNK